MKCGECGKSNLEDAKFCAYCGAPMAGAGNSHAAGARRRASASQFAGDDEAFAPRRERRADDYAGENRAARRVHGARIADDEGADALDAARPRRRHEAELAEPAARKPRRPIDDDFDDMPPRKPRRPIDDDFDDMPPRKAKSAPAEDFDDMPSRKARRPVEDEADDIAARRAKRAAIDDMPRRAKRPAEDELDESPRKAKRPVEDEFDEEPTRRINKRDDDDDAAPARKARDSSGNRAMFMFDDEDEDESDFKRQGRKRPSRAASFDDLDDDDEDDNEEEYSGRGGRAIRVVTLIALLIVLVGSSYLLLRSELGARLRASTGVAASAQDYITLAEWQYDRGNTADSTSSYLKAFSAGENDYDVVQTIAKGFVAIGDMERAEQTYMALITKNPTLDDPYDMLLALFNMQGKDAEYQALIAYRAEHQPGYAPAKPAAPTSNTAPGTFETAISLELSAEAGAKIYYTLDGSAPTSGSTPYEAAIDLPAGATTTVRAIAVLNGGTSDEWMGQYVIGG